MTSQVWTLRGESSPAWRWAEQPTPPSGKLQSKQSSRQLQNTGVRFLISLASPRPQAAARRSCTHTTCWQKNPKQNNNSNKTDATNQGLKQLRASAGAYARQLRSVLVRDPAPAGAGSGTLHRVGAVGQCLQGLLCSSRKAATPGMLAAELCVK